MKPQGNKMGVCHGWILNPWKQHTHLDKAKAKSGGILLPCESPSQRFSKRTFAVFLGKLLAHES